MQDFSLLEDFGLDLRKQIKGTFYLSSRVSYERELYEQKEMANQTYDKDCL